MATRLLTTAAAAAALDVHAGTLTRWAREGIVTPENRTAGGHARWDLDKLREQIAEHQRRQDQDQDQP